jgi:hypothetical protein
MDDGDEAARRVRTLLLSGDNTLKNRTGPGRVAAARMRFEEARRVAGAAGLDQGVLEIIDRRLEALPREAGGNA